MVPGIDAVRHSRNGRGRIGIALEGDIARSFRCFTIAATRSSCRTLTTALEELFARS